MKQTIRILFLMAIFITCAGSAMAQVDGLALMKVEVGARPSGMGGAFVAVPGDPMSGAYNPAGAIGAKQFSATFGHNQYWENIRFETGYFVAPLSDKLALHGGVKFAVVSDLESRLVPSVEPMDIFDAHDVSFKAGMAYRLTDKISAGFAVGYFVEKIESYEGSAFNADFGLQAQVTPAISLGASAGNLGSSFKLEQAGVEVSDEIDLPTIYRFGGSYRYLKYLGVADIVIVDDEAHPHFGVEGEVYDNFLLRTGYMAGYDSKNFTAGASFLIPRYNVGIDYSFVPYSNDLGSTHLFNLTVGL